MVKEEYLKINMLALRFDLLICGGGSNLTTFIEEITIEIFGSKTCIFFLFTISSDLHKSLLVGTLGGFFE